MRTLDSAERIVDRLNWKLRELRDRKPIRSSEWPARLSESAYDDILSLMSDARHRLEQLATSTTPALVWTTSAPTVPGFYWIRNADRSICGVCEVAWRDMEPGGMISRALAEGYEIAGPVAQPKDEGAAR